MQIRAAVAAAKSEPFSIEALELEEPRDDEVLVRMVGVGICHTDLVVRDQYYPTQLPAVESNRRADSGREGKRAQARTGAAPDLERRHHQQELVHLFRGQLLQEEVLDDVDAVVGDQEHVDREDLKRRREEQRWPLLEREGVVAHHACSVIDEKLRPTNPGPG
jgi:hypothetical protein